MTDNANAIRARANELIGLLLASQQGAGARQLAQLMADLGFFPSAVQRPIRCAPSLRSAPVHPAGNFPVATYLETHASAIREEVAAACAADRLRFVDVEEPLLADGRWDELVFFEAGIPSEAAARLLPRTFAILRDLPADVRSAGVIMLSRLAPRSHIVPHCGETNARLRVHLGIKVPPDAVMRVGSQSLRWQEGRCVVFDDSYEHEVWNLGDEDRIVLIVDVPHPDARAGAVDPGQQRQGALAERLALLLADAHLAGVEIEPGSGRCLLHPDTYLARKLTRGLSELGVHRLDADARR